MTDRIDSLRKQVVAADSSGAQVAAAAVEEAGPLHLPQVLTEEHLWEEGKA